MWFNSFNVQLYLNNCGRQYCTHRCGGFCCSSDDGFNWRNRLWLRNSLWHFWKRNYWRIKLEIWTARKKKMKKDTMKIQGMSFHFWPHMWNSSPNLTGVDVNDRIFCKEVVGDAGIATMTIIVNQNLKKIHENEDVYMEKKGEIFGVFWIRNREFEEDIGEKFWRKKREKWGIQTVFHFF